MMTRKVVDAVLSLSERNRFSKGLFSWVGFKTKWIEYDNIERAAGKSSFSFWQLTLYAIEGIIAFSTVPLAIATVMGILVFLVSLAMAFYYLIKTIFIGDPVEGFPTLIVIILFGGHPVALYGTA
jgi:hypothetical protein